MSPTFSVAPGQLIGATETAQVFGVSRHTVIRWGKTGRIPSVVLPNGQRVFSRTWCQEYLTEQVSTAVPLDQVGS